MIGIIDYGGGNIGSVKNALSYLGINSILAKDENSIRKANSLIMPGQGRFGDCILGLSKRKLLLPLKEEMSKGKPFLGICIGQQILFSRSEEDVGIDGLGLIKGNVVKFSLNQKVPQIGWNSVNIKKETQLFCGIFDGSFFYFVHSYYTNCLEANAIIAQTNYGISYPCAVAKKNIFGVQFHPEKSGKAGLKLLKNFCKRVK
ncbi:MAG: imidazole glycerol phosphate synthase subunit HisH [archaeon]